VSYSTFRDDGEIILSGFNNGKIRVFQTSTRHALRTLKAHSTNVNTISVNRVNYASGADEGVVKYWDLSSLDPVLTISTAHGDYVKKVILRQEELYSSSYDGMLKMWDVRESGEKEEMVWAMKNPIEDFTFIDEFNFAVANGNLISLFDI
jgi:WD40 repeat protein